MVGYNSEESTSDVLVTILLTRKAGNHKIALAKVQLEKAPWNYEYVKIKDPDITLFINGKNHGKVNINSQGDAELSRKQTDALVKSLLHTSTIIFKDKANNLIGQLSDQGSTATFLKMDEWQGRLYTDTAIVKKGKRSHQQLIKMIAPPIIKRAKTIPLSEEDKQYFIFHAEEILNTIKKGMKKGDDENYCDAIFENEKLYLADRLSKHQLLVSAHCWTGAYNQGSGYWIINDQKPYSPNLIITDANYYLNGKLEATHKGRGIGDCWSSQTFVWDGKSFALSSRSNTGLCRGFAGGAWKLSSFVSKVTN